MVPECAGLHLYNEKNSENIIIFPLHCEDDGIFFLLPSKFIDDLHVDGRRNGRHNDHLPHEEENENKVYDKGNFLCSTL